MNATLITGASSGIGEAFAGDKGSVLSPAGTIENSPAIHRWVCGAKQVASPVRDERKENSHAFLCQLSDALRFQHEGAAPINHTRDTTAPLPISGRHRTRKQNESVINWRHRGSRACAVVDSLNPLCCKIRSASQRQLLKMDSRDISAPA